MCDDTTAQMIEIHIVRTVTTCHQRISRLWSPASARQQLKIVAGPDRIGSVRPALAAIASKPIHFCIVGNFHIVIIAIIHHVVAYRVLPYDKKIQKEGKPLAQPLALGSNALRSTALSYAILVKNP